MSNPFHRVPKGTYYISSTLEPENVVITGENRSNTKIVSNLDIFAPISNVTISNLYFITENNKVAVKPQQRASNIVVQWCICENGCLFYNYRYSPYTTTLTDSDLSSNLQVLSCECIGSDNITEGICFNYAKDCKAIGNKITGKRHGIGKGQ